jgi:hypothetical protein
MSAGDFWLVRLATWRNFQNERFGIDSDTFSPFCYLCIDLGGNILVAQPQPSPAIARSGLNFIEV